MFHRDSEGREIQRIIWVITLIILSFGANSLSIGASQTEDPAPHDSVKSKEKDVTITLGFGGDVMLGRLVDQVIQEKGPRYIWGDVLPLLQEPALTFANLECVIAKKGEPFRPRRVFYFRAQPGAVKALTLAGIDYLSIANNHAMDFGEEALLETIQHLDANGIAHAGAGKDLTEAAKPAFLKAGGIKIGVVAFADHFREYGAGINSPGTNIIEVNVKKKNFQRIGKAIQSARDDGADLVVFSIHWGPNMRQEPTRKFVEFAHAVMDAGADIYHGHSAHIFQGIEIYKGKPILYDTGELIDDYYVDPVLRNDQQLLFLITVTPRGPQRIELIPLLIDEMQVNRAKGPDFTRIKERVVRLSDAFGTDIVQEKDRFVVHADSISRR